MRIHHWSGLRDRRIINKLHVCAGNHCDLSIDDNIFGMHQAKGFVFILENLNIKNFGIDSKRCETFETSDADTELRFLVKSLETDHFYVF